jgi:hypothetical protein
MPIRMAKPNPRANPAIDTAVMSEKTKGEFQWPVMLTAATWSATSPTTSTRLRTSPV